MDRGIPCPHHHGTGSRHMTIRKLFDKAKHFEVDLYNVSSDFTRSHVAFTGTPEKHPREKDKILLFIDPFSACVTYYEFTITDIAGVEELPSIVSMEGKSVTMYRIWVRKGSLGIRSTPFIVEDTSHIKVR
jgi:hypothetical protein